MQIEKSRSKFRISLPVAQSAAQFVMKKQSSTFSPLDTETKQLGNFYEY